MTLFNTEKSFVCAVAVFEQVFDGGSKQMLNGTIVHDIFQKAAMSSDFSSENIQTVATEALRSPNYLGQM